MLSCRLAVTYILSPACYLYLIIPFCCTSALCKVYLVEPWFVLWQTKVDLTTMTAPIEQASDWLKICEYGCSKYAKVAFTSQVLHCSLTGFLFFDMLANQQWLLASKMSCQVVENAKASEGDLEASSKLCHIQLVALFSTCVLS